MTATQRTLGRARRRLVGHNALRALGWGVLIGAAAAGLAVVGMHFVGVPVPWWGLASVGGAAVLVAALVAVLRRPNDQRVAVLVDERLGLKDRLGTSLYAASLEDSELTRRVIDDAERAAGEAKVGQAFPVRPTPVWWGALAAVAAVAVLALDPFGLQQRALAKAQAKLAAAEEARQLEEALENAKEEAEALAEDAEARDEDGVAEDELDPADLDEQLEALLTQRDLSNPEDQREAAAEVSDLQEKFEEQIAQQEAAVEALQNTFSQLDAGERGPTDRFADALRRGDFSSAQEELARLADQIESGDLSESQRERASEQLAALSEQLEQMAEQQEQLAEEAEQAANQAMENAGLTPEQMEQLAEQGFSPEAVQQALEQALQNQGMTQEQAQQAAEQLQQQMQQAMQQARNSQNAGDAAEQLAQQMQQMSQAMQQQGLENQQLQDAIQQMQQQLGECAGEQGQLQNMKSASQQMQEALQRMARLGQTDPNRPGGAGGIDGGGGDGGDPIGDERAPLNPNSRAVSDANGEPRGRVIASWTRDGQMSKGEARVTFNQAVTEAQADAERAVTEDRTPKRYHKAIRDYFGNLPTRPEDAN
ncbi:MAG: hypothetical protein AAFX76_09840 [Planctomycetota bacterium]